MDLLFGLDNLKRHQCCIDLVEHRLHFNRGEFSVAFLGEGDIKRNSFEAEKELMLERQRSHGASSAQESASGAEEAAVKELVEMGFTAPQVREALRVCDNNKEHAMNYLLNQGSQ